VFVARGRSSRQLLDTATCFSFSNMEYHPPLAMLVQKDAMDLLVRLRQARDPRAFSSMHSRCCC
jgi:hypothetical protein